MPSKMRGGSEMVAKLRRIADKFPDRVGKAIVEEAKIELKESQRRVPVDTGDLRKSGKVTGPNRKGRNISATISYGGADYNSRHNANVPVIVHEDLEAFHPHGQAKYLESVLNESRSDMLGRIAKRVHLDKGDE